MFVLCAQEPQAQAQLQAHKLYLELFLAKVELHLLILRMQSHNGVVAVGGVCEAHSCSQAYMHNAIVN